MNERVALRQEAKRRQVRDGALRVFSERGYRAASMQDIADAIGMGKASLYHYVSSKEEVLTDLYEEVLRDNVLEVRRIAAQELRPVDALREVIVDRVVYTCHNRRLLNIFFEEEAELPPRRRAQLIRVRREYEDAVLAIVAAAEEAGEIALDTAPRVFVNTVLGAANWVYKWFDPKGPLDAETLGDQMAATLLSGVLPR